jgi:CDP-glucose 4,6-dehydratase
MGTTMSGQASWRHRNVLVTGAGGFVGSWLALALVERGARVHVLLRDQPALCNLRLLDLEQHVDIVHGSITDEATVQRVVNEHEVDTVFHLAAQAIVGAANRSPVSTFESNIRGTWTVLEACRVNAVERVVVASSDKAYGAQRTLPYTEDMALLGDSPYEASKVCTDVLSRTYHATYGLPVAVTRCANIYGGGDVNFSRLIPGTIRSVLRGERPIIRSDGSPVRDYMHVDDAVTAYLRLAERLDAPGISGRAFNFGTNHPVSVLEMAMTVLDEAGRTDLEPDVRGQGSLAGEIDEQYLEASAAAELLGWSAEIPLADGLRRSIDWYREHLAAA